MKNRLEMDHEIEHYRVCSKKKSALDCIGGGVWTKGGVTCHEIDTQSRPQDISRGASFSEGELELELIFE